MHANLYVLLPLALLCCAITVDSVITPIQKIEDKTLCGRSKIVNITCVFVETSEAPSIYIAQVKYITEDGNQETLCPNPPYESTPVNLTLVPGDSIYGMRICYDGKFEKVIGIMFGGIAQQYTCGDVWQPASQCVMSSTLSPGPLSYMQPVCSAVFVGVKYVCWNKYYIPTRPQQQCPAGQGVASGSTLCSACPAGTFNPGGLGSCVKCADNQTSSERATICGCEAGSGFQPRIRRCLKCPPGTYSPGGSLSPCISCPLPFMTTPYGSAGIEECVCQPGYGYNSTAGACMPCPKDSYADGKRDAGDISPGSPTLKACTACPAPNTTTNRPQAVRVTQCKAP